MLLSVRDIQESTKAEVRHHKPLVSRVGAPVEAEPRAVRHGLVVSEPEGSHVFIAVPAVSYTHLTLPTKA